MIVQNEAAVFELADRKWSDVRFDCQLSCRSLGGRNFSLSLQALYITRGFQSSLIFNQDQSRRTEFEPSFPLEVQKKGSKHIGLGKSGGVVESARDLRYKYRYHPCLSPDVS